MNTDELEILTKEKLRSKPYEPERLHVVILGAGASKAALPNGDASGNKIPLLDDLPNILGQVWKNLVLIANPPKSNFETIFSWLKLQGKYEYELQKVEKLIENYFDSLCIPDSAIIYDYLILGLRGKDIIATFNWDPFLMQAHKRNRSVVELPDIRFLHGSVAFATCVDHDILGAPSEICPKCHKYLKRGILFYPEENKDYAKDSIIERDWDQVREYLAQAFHLTIFGYSGPATDYNARKLLLKSWNKTPMKMVSHAEIIDIKDPQVIRDCWSEYFPYHHEMTVQSFWDSSIARWPRRTAEWKYGASVYGKPAEAIGPFRTNSLEELQRWFSELAKTESSI